MKFIQAGILLILAATSALAAPMPPELSALPDPLVMNSGEAVSKRSQWFKKRRPELMAMFQHTMYGHLPPPPKKVTADVRRVDAEFLGGKATLKEISLGFGPADAPKINLLLVVPNDRKGRVPVVLGLNFCGNHSVSADTRIALPEGWMPSSCAGCTNNAATDAGRGRDADSWCLEQIIARGYAVATFYNGDIEPDHPDATTGIRAYAAQGGLKDALKSPRKDWKCRACDARYEKGDYDWGTIAAWSWGLQRAVDYLSTNRDIDRKRIIVFGHSRNGKTALLAGAFDDRIALILCHQAGCGGSAPSRGKIGESVKQINDRFPHWFNAEFKKYNNTPDTLPLDQHELIALCAPRPVLLSNAVEDTWANPAGQFAMLQAVNSLYRWLSGEGFATTRMPEPGRLIASRLGYFIRPGRHSTTCEDWTAFLDFADAQLPAAK